MKVEIEKQVDIRTPKTLQNPSEILKNMFDKKSDDINKFISKKNPQKTVENDSKNSLENNRTLLEHINSLSQFVLEPKLSTETKNENEVNIFATYLCLKVYMKSFHFFTYTYFLNVATEQT